jgi:hypothetical protein
MITKLNNKPVGECKCGKPIPIAPKYCKECGQSSLGNKKLVVVGGYKCIQVTNWEKDFDKQDFCFTNWNGKRILHTNYGITNEVKSFIQSKISEAYNKGYRKGIKDEYLGLKHLSVKKKQL